MPAQVSWYVPNRVVYLRLYGIITLEDIQNGSHLVNAMFAATTTEKKHAFVDALGVEKINVSLSALTRVEEGQPSSLTGWTIVVQNADSFLSKMVQIIGTAYGQIFQRRMRMLNSLAEARQFLYEVDEGLLGLPVLLEALHD